MGLSVTVYSNVKKCNDPEYSDFTAYVIDDRWKHKIKNLEDGAAYTGKPIASAAGYAYSTHSRFREYLVGLAKVKGVLDMDGRIIWGALYDNMPFYDFIDFADNEGCFDWETASRILSDFDKYADANENSSHSYMIEYYKKWRTALKATVDNNGVVVFG